MIKTTMLLLLLFLNLLFLCVKVECENKDVKIVLKLNPEQIMDTLESIMSSDYIQKLAKEFAVQAAQHLIEEMHNKKDEMQIKYKRNRLTENITKTDEPPKKDDKALLDEREAFTLIHAPAPDGDNQDAVSTELTGSEENRGDRIPVIQVMKINGMYFRRLLGLL